MRKLTYILYKQVFMKKMCTLYDWYNCVLLKKKWKYYKDSPSFQIKMLKDQFKCKEFIKEMMRAGGKGCEYLNGSLDKLNSSRIKHIVSCFLLGFTFLENTSIKDSIEKKLKILCHGYSENCLSEFPYLWMLICFFHDLGYSVEEGDVAPKKDIAFPPYWEISVFLPCIYTPESVYAYEQFREKECNVPVDHGIYGGEVCYKELCEIRKQHEKARYNKLYWGKPLEKVYACISWTIMCHNIFFVQKDEKDVEQAEYYNKNGLDKFVYQTSTRKITLKSSPFLYLLCLVDTLEPLKKFGDTLILHNISLDVNNMEMEADSEKFRTIGKLKEFGNYKKSVAGLNDWLCDFHFVDYACERKTGAAPE